MTRNGESSIFRITSHPGVFWLGFKEKHTTHCGNRMTSLMFFVGSEFICNSLVLLSKHIVIHLEVNFLRCNADSDFDWHLRAQIAPITFHLNLNSSRSLSNIALLHLIIPWFLGYTWYHFSKQYIIISGLWKWLYHFSIWFSLLQDGMDALRFQLMRSSDTFIYV